VFSFKFFFARRLAASICLTSLRSALAAAAFSEAERIVFAAEGCSLLMTFRSIAESWLIGTYETAAQVNGGNSLQDLQARRQKNRRSFMSALYYTALSA
jgi:hypothetical protein